MDLVFCQFKQLTLELSDRVRSEVRWSEWLGWSKKRTTMKRTGVFATEEEMKEITQLHEQARRTPAIAFSSAHALERGGCAGEAWDDLMRTVHKHALSHGLPEIQGYYGIDGANREFVEA